MTEHSGSGHSRLTALVVEDNATDRSFFAQVLASRGHEVTECADGESALEHLERAGADLVLLDLQLPGIDGLEVCRRIRERDDTPRPFIIVVTSTEEADTLAEALDAGADDFMKKPVEPSVLMIRLRIAESRIRSGRALSEARAALDSKIRELELLFNNLQDVFFSVDLSTGRLIQVSPGVRDLLGVEPDVLLDDPEGWRRIFGEGEPPWGDPPREASFAEEFTLPDPAGGGRRWVRASGRVVRDPTDGHLRADGLLVDITEERAARFELETLHRLAELTLSATSLEEAYDQILELVSEAMGCRIVAIEHLDRDRDRLVMTAAKGIPAAEEREVSIPLHRTLSGIAVRTGRPLVEADPASRKEHAAPELTSLDLKCYAAFPLGVGGEVTGTLLLADTEPRDMDEAWVRLGTSLAATITSYLERLQAQAAIRESEQRYRILAAALQQANQELESFAYSVSHDLRAPLRTMQGFAHALLQNCAHELSDEARDYVRRIIASGEMAERLISDLLAYSRLSFEKWDLSSVDLETVVQDALAQLEADVREASAHVRVDRPLPPVRANHTALVQALTNLISNAIKFVPDERKPEVRIHAERREDVVRLWVEDNGVGIPPGQEERIFRVFERLADSGNRPGTGIGLAIVRRAVERMEGTCGVERLPDGGSAFWIELPAAESSPSRRGFWHLR